ncbi:response regulator [Blastomonas sp.]|uniref:response regulator n=1 Tax=Blastomonas sp. TaxID=1909299 RepID=UPI002619B553|nr:response regulator [Blastomonas sp.]MDM7955145.1 response regulator [Blastomonas sp.]
MTDLSLNGRRILVVEDEYLVADELHMELERIGATVIGPVASLADAIAIIAATPHIDGAVLDGNLKGEMVFPAADQLLDRGIPIVFVSGYDALAIPERFRQAPRCDKPVGVRRIIETLKRALELV